jgi:hypothetical protein
MDNAKAEPDQDSKSLPAQQEEPPAGIAESRDAQAAQSVRGPAAGRKPLFGR